MKLTTMAINRVIKKTTTNETPIRKGSGLDTAPLIIGPVHPMDTFPCKKTSLNMLPPPANGWISPLTLKLPKHPENATRIFGICEIVM